VDSEAHVLSVTGPRPHCRSRRHSARETHHLNFSTCCCRPIASLCIRYLRTAFISNLFHTNVVSTFQFHRRTLPFKHLYFLRKSSSYYLNFLRYNSNSKGYTCVLHSEPRDPESTSESTNMVPPIPHVWQIRAKTTRVLHRRQVILSIS
jgi:hypothetical protein